MQVHFLNKIHIKPTTGTVVTVGFAAADATLAGLAVVHATQLASASLLLT